MSIRRRSVTSFLILLGLVSPAWAQNANTVDLAVTQDIAPSVGYEGRAPDVLGIQFGDTREDAIAKLKALHPEAQVTELTDYPGVGDGNGNEVYFNFVHAARMSVEGTPSEEILLRFTTTVTGGRVYQISRTVRYPNTAYGSMSDLRAAIASKYGKPTLIELYPHQSRDDIYYTWERRPIPDFGEQNVAERPFNAEIPDNVDRCLLVAESSYYNYDNLYSFVPPGTRYVDADRADCIGAIKFSIFYGGNNATVSQLTVMATDYDRSRVDAQAVDEVLAQLLIDKANAVQGSGAPAL